MKILFFLLALANVALFMWEYRQGAFSPVPETPAGNIAGYPEQIVLLSEMDSNTEPAGQTDTTTTSEDADTAGKDEKAAKSPEAESVSEQSTDAAMPVLEAPVPVATPNDSGIKDDKQIESAAVACYEAGPFANNSVYQIWEKRLNGFIKGIDRDEQIVSDYLVYYPASATLGESKANVQMLKDKGVNDLYMINKGEEQGQISLGVYKKEERALIMKNDLLAKGINAEIKARYKSKAQKFAFIKGESAAIENLELLKKEYPKVNVKQADGATVESCL
jgi:hypothetical protein